jgi:uncharacterized protein YecA (UPF0149 family)
MLRHHELVEVESEPQSTSEPVRSSEKALRNAPCPCGSGKKYKKCHLGKEGDA